MAQSELELELARLRQEVAELSAQEKSRRKKTRQWLMSRYSFSLPC
jgi:hypothetical protein